MARAAYQEHKTAELAAEVLREAGADVRTGLAGTGVAGIVRGRGPGKTIAIRADMDALPVEEQTGLPFASRNPGVMHACGHDSPRRDGARGGGRPRRASGSVQRPGHADHGAERGDDRQPGGGEASVTTDSQRVELVALRAQVEVLRGQIESYEKETKDLQARLNRQANETESLGQQLAEERGKNETLGNRVTEVDRLLITQTTEAEILGRRVQELVARLDEQGRFLADRESVSDRLRSETTVAQKIEADLRKELAEAEARQRFATEAIRSEKALLEDQLKQSQEERAKLQREISGMKREAESTWESERMENALLRERINDVAAEVAKLTATLEGPGSPIETILAAEAPRPAVLGNGTNGGSFPSIAPNGGKSKGTLADRIRALQGRASRVPQASGA